MKLYSGAHMRDEPSDRLTRIAGRLIEAFEADPEYEEDDRCALMFSDGQDHRGGMVILGYESPLAVIVDMLAFVQATAATQGIDMDLITINDDGITR